MLQPTNSGLLMERTVVAGLTALRHVFSKSLLILGRNDIIHSFGKNFWLKFLAVINLMNIVMPGG